MTAPLGHEEMQPGEIQRTLSRIEVTLGALQSEMRERSHKQSNEIQVQAAIGIELKVRMTNVETDIDGVGQKVQDMDRRMVALDRKAAALAGAVSMLSLIGNGIVAWFLKR